MLAPAVKRGVRVPWGAWLVLRKGLGDCLLLEFSVLRLIWADKSVTCVSMMFASLSL